MNRRAKLSEKIAETVLKADFSVEKIGELPGLFY